MKKILKILIGVIVFLTLPALLFFGVLYLKYNEDLPIGQEGEKADLLAHNMLKSLDYESYKETDYIEWSFRNSRLYKWNKRENICVVQWKDFKVDLHLNYIERSLAAVHNFNVVGEKRDELVDKARSYFNNDSFWLVAPYKVFDKGVKRSIVNLDNDDEVVLDAVKKVKAANHHIEEVFCPFPVHGLDKAMGLAPTRIAITSFMYGITGLGIAIWLTYYTMIADWPQDIGGKPSFSWAENMPAFVPIMFELTVFFAAHLMVITFYMRSRIWPFKKAENPDPRTTDDHFLMEIEIHDNEEELTTLLNETGAVEINVVDKH